MKPPIPMPSNKQNVDFFDSLSKEEWEELWTSSRLKGATAERWWRMNEYQGEPPPSILIEVSRRVT